MTKETTPRDLADELKSYLYPPKPGEQIDYAALVTRFNDLCRAAPRGVPDIACAQNEMANHLLVLAESKQDKVLVKAALKGLLDSGRLGHHAACRFVKSGSIALEQLAPMVGTLPPRQRLHLLQELLRSPSAEEKTLMLWARQQLAPLSEAPPEEVLSFLDSISHTGDSLIHPIRNTILSGTFPAWLAGKLASTLPRGEFSSMCRAVHALESQDAVRRMAAFIARGGAIPDAEDIRLITEAGDMTDASLSKAFQMLLGSGEETSALAGVEGLSRLAWPKTGQGFGLLYKKYPNLRAQLATKAATLPHACLMDFLRSLGTKPRLDVLTRIFTILARLDPDFALARIAQGQKLNPVAAKSLKSFVSAQKKESLAGIKRRAMRPDPGGPVGLEKRGLVKRLFSEKKQDLAEVLEMVHSPKEKSLPGSEFSGAVTSRSLTKLDLTGSYFTKAQFIKATFSAVVFSQSAFIEVDFTGCTFNNCTFSESLFRSTTFTACDFKNCEFTDAAFDDCAMTEGKVERCFFTGAVLRATHFSALRLRFSSFNLCQLQESFFTSVLFEASALTHCQFIDCALDGCEMDSCEMAHSTFLSSNLTSSMLVRSNLGDCTFIGSSSDNGAFEQARMDDLLTRASTLEMKPASPPGMASSVPDFLLAITDQWSRRLNILRYHAPMLRNNQRRLEHSARRMAGEDCFWLVPYLLHTDLIDQKLKLGAAPPCRLEGYTPSFRALSIAAVILKDLAPTPPTAPPLVIQGLYAMGSIGSVAQTRASDVDYWVCYDPASATPKKLEGLRVKLAAITDWAMETYELEVYFFLMSMDDVRRNEFGFSDKESSGSAQAILLKEEFYRTVVPVAGMHPAWWVTPSGVSEAAHRKWLAAARTLPTPEAPRFVDMGHLSPIPADEFFGAALWQIVKALHSPYKSVMKLGLLEKYSSQPKVLMMADQIKSNLVNRQREVERIDPYVVLFRELRDYYRNANEGETVKLLTEALLLKAKVGEFDFFFGFPSIFEEHSLLEFLFGKGKVTENKVRSLGQDWSFAKSMQIGKTVSHFMTATYKRIQGSLVTGGTATKARITPEDRTRLGRQISANFARKKNKIVRVPFLGVKGYPELHFLADKSPGKPTVWAVQGLTPSEGKKSVKDTEPLFRAENPGTLLAWLVMNRLFAPKTLVDGESSIAPMSAVDIKNALAQLHAFFHYDTTFELPPDDYLGSERVTMALLLINLAQQPELNTVASVDVIYATSWGEVFCVSVPKPGVQIKKNVRSWLAATLPHDASTPTRLKAFYPKRSQCPRLPGI